MRLRLIGALGLTVAVLSACGGGGGSSLFDDEVVIGSSFVAQPFFLGASAAVAGRVLFLGSEFAQNGSDRNGDGDPADNVMHLLDPDTGTTTNLGLAARPPLAGGLRFAAFGVAEQDQGNQDLSGDLDALDTVLAIYDATLPVGPTNPRLTSVSIAANGPIVIDGNFVTVITAEADIATDLNFDGDQNDFVPRVFDAVALTVMNTIFAWDTTAAVLTAREGLLAWIVNEAADSFDSNGDGDTTDSVLVGWFFSNPGTFGIGPTFPLGRAVVPPVAILGSMGSLRVAYLVNESQEGVGTNLNAAYGDTDSTDNVLAVRDFPAAGEFFPGGGLAVDPASVSGSGTRIGYAALEASNGPASDFNVDGDAVDSVVFWTDLGAASGGSNLGLALLTGAGNLRVCDESMLFIASEAEQGPAGTNWNAAIGDTDITDGVAFFVDISAPSIPARSTGHATRQILCFAGEPLFFITAAEADDGGFDLNGDGDTNDVVPLYYRTAGATLFPGQDPIIVDGPISIQVCTEFVRIWSNISEANGFNDLNLDTDADDYVLCVTRIRRDNGKIMSFEPLYTCDRDGTSFALQVDRDTFIFPTAEDKTGAGLNLNAVSGDQDTVDLILQFVNSSC